MIPEKRRPKISSIPLMALMNLFFLFIIAMAAADDPPAGFFESLKKRLVADGFKEELIRQIYANDNVFFETRGVTQYFMHNEAKLNYSRLTRKPLIEEARKYMQEHAAPLAEAQRLFQVDPRAITAIILVETNFGKTLGTKSILNTFSTMAVLDESAPREYLWEQLPPKSRIERSEYDQKADQKAAWAYNELKALLTYCELHGMDPTQLTGSYAGAMGIAQFIPSNVLPFGKDGNGDGRINLYEDADAIFSIASYLKEHGWKPDQGRDGAYKAIYSYNHSKYYVDTILKIMDLIEG